MRTSLLAFVAASLLGACVATVGPAGPRHPPPEPPPPPPGRPERHEPRVLEGVVIDAVTHQPIDRAGIDIQSPGRPEVTIVTGPDGRYRTPEIPRGEFNVRFRREGYEAVSRNQVMNEGIMHMDCELRPKHH